MNKNEALALVRKYTKNENLVKHMIAVGGAMKMYAKKFNENEQEWEVCGILHDFDYEKMKDEHPSKWGSGILRENGIKGNVIAAIEAHGKRSDSGSRVTKLAKVLFAVDELTGLIVACALVRPDKLSGLGVQSVLKKMKDKSFASGVHREDIVEGAKSLGVELADHIQTVIDGMLEVRDELGL